MCFKIGIRDACKKGESSNNESSLHMFFIYAVLWMIVSIVVGTFKFGTQVPNKYLIFQKFISTMKKIMYENFITNNRQFLCHAFLDFEPLTLEGQTCPILVAM